MGLGLTMEVLAIYHEAKKILFLSERSKITQLNHLL